MTITLNTFPLCDGYDRTPGKLVGPKDFTEGNNIVSQTVNPIRAPKATILDRGNESWSMSWSCDASFANEADAVAFMVAFKANYPRSGTLYFDDVAQGSGVVLVSLRQLGAGVIIQFRAEIAL